MAAERSSLLLLLLAAVLAGCGYAGPPLAGYEGLQLKVESFYEARAFEKDATCTRPRMTPVRATVVEETPERVVMNVRDHFRDDGRAHRRHARPGARGVLLERARLVEALHLELQPLAAGEQRARVTAPGEQGGKQQQARASSSHRSAPSRPPRPGWRAR